MTIYHDLAAYRPLESKQGQPKMPRHDIICLHTMVGNLTSTDRFFKQSGWSGTEAHFGIGGPWGDGLDGVIYQWQDDDYRADANLEGNHRVISIETGDNAPKLAKDIAPWSKAQVTAIVRLVARLCKQKGIPAVLVPDTRSDRRGIAYHRQGVQHSGGTHPAGFLQPNCERWSTAVGKECPGDARIAQVPEIVARVRAVLAGPIAPQEDDMAFEPKDVWTGKGTDMIPHNEPGPSPRVPTDPENPTWYPASTLEETNRVVRDLLARVKAQDEKLDEILAKFDTPPTGK